jgi:hypothetical protein
MLARRQSMTFHQPPLGRLGFLLPVALASACVSTPHVQYVEIEAPKEETRGVPQFRLAGSRVSLGLAAPSDGAKKPVAPSPVSVGPLKTTQELLAAKPSVLVTPAEAGSIYGIVPRPSIFSSIALSVSYFDNTRLVKSIGAPVTDNTLKVISSVGGILSVLAPFVLHVREATPELFLPVVLDFADGKKLEEALSDAGAAVPGATAWWYRLHEATPDKAAEDAKAFFKPGSTVESFPYSACLNGTLELWTGSDPSRRFKTGDVARFPVTIADPRHVRTIALPAKGIVVMHTVCGADVKAENADIAGTFAVLEALAKQAEAIYTAATNKK